MTARFDFASDVCAGAMPETLEALGRFNAGFAAGYGDDEVTARAGDLIRRLLDADAPVWFVSSGTAANALALAAVCRPFESVLAHRYSHVIVDEAGAPGLFGAGMGLIGLPGAVGLVDPSTLQAALAREDDPHWQPPGALSLTNATEFGAVYGVAEFERLIGTAKSSGLKAHVDGARLANAVAAGFDATAAARAGVDILVVGGSKVGATPTEAVVLLDRTLERRFGSRLKHAGQLAAKSRFLAAPWIGMLENGAWIARAAHANAMAKRLAALVPFPLAHPVTTNAVFLTMDEAAQQRLTGAGWISSRFADHSVRLMCSWATTTEAVDELGAALQTVL